MDPRLFFFLLAERHALAQAEADTAPEPMARWLLTHPRNRP